MLIIPAMDLLEGKVVRLNKGDMASPTVYSGDPIKIANNFLDMGVRRLHLVDLDGAKTGSSVNFGVIEQISKLGLIVEAGGGVRDIAAAERFFNAGVCLVIVGTAVVKDKTFVKELLKKYPRKVILGIDSRRGFVATDGWYDTTEIKASDLVLEYKDCDAESVIFTDIEHDGTLSGVNLEAMAAFADVSPFKVIVSGGVSGVKDIAALTTLHHPNILGAVIGKAIYERKIELSAILYD